MAEPATVDPNANLSDGLKIALVAAIVVGRAVSIPLRGAILYFGLLWFFPALAVGFLPALALSVVAAGTLQRIVVYGKPHDAGLAMHAGAAWISVLWLCGYLAILAIVRGMV